MLRFVSYLIARAIALVYGYKSEDVWHVPHPLGEVTLRVIYVKRSILGRFWGITLCDVLVTSADHYISKHAMHEATHTHQCRRYGAFFPLVYLWASLVALVTSGKPYTNNRFEVEARSYENA